VIDYGAYPDQDRRYFSTKDVRKTLEDVAGAVSFEAAIYAGLDALIGRLMSQAWNRDGDGASLRPERVLIDAHWPRATDTVEKFCRQSAHAAVLLPSHGMFIGATRAPMSEYRTQPGDKVGLNWRIPKGKRHVSFDTNFWKTFVHARLSTPMGGKSGLTPRPLRQPVHDRRQPPALADGRRHVDRRLGVVDGAAHAADALRYEYHNNSYYFGHRRHDRRITRSARARGCRCRRRTRSSTRRSRRVFAEWAKIGGAGADRSG
jgi:hypothetical protein